MNKAIIESIEWHKDCLFKLLGDDDFVKIEGEIQSVKSDLNEIVEKAKAKKRVWVKATATKKGHYREMEVGRKEEEKLGGEEKRAIYENSYNHGYSDRQNRVDRQDPEDSDYDVTLHKPKNPRDQERADGYSDGWSEAEEETR